MSDIQSLENETTHGDMRKPATFAIAAGLQCFTVWC
jgi:hypothetical protein